MFNSFGIYSPFYSSLTRTLIIGSVVLALNGCSLLGFKADAIPPSLYAIEPSFKASSPSLSGEAAQRLKRMTLVVNAPHVSAGFETSRMIYIRQPHKLEYFAHNEWAAPPASMLQPVIISALEQQHAFKSVVKAPTSIIGELQLSLEMVRLQQEFIETPSKVRFTLRAQLLESATRHVLASREFDVSVAAENDNPYGGVVAANKAVQQVSQELAAFCVQSSQSLPDPVVKRNKE